MDTIASIVTPIGESAVSIIRISGDNSWPIAEKLSKKSFQKNNFKLCWIHDHKESKKVDQSLILPFKAPHSFTAEDVIEIQCHGGVWLSQKILDLVLENGARLAKAGEFTERAFLNHKIDLSQAESIMDLVSARSSLSGSNAIKIYEGFLGQEILKIRSKLMELLAGLTAGIDFPDEVGDFNEDEYKKVVTETIRTIKALLESEEEGHILRHGYKVALVGDPNVGKSSLLNVLLKKDRAIVTDIAGTTRDTIEESYSLKGVPVVLVDTAGIRNSDDTVEKIGIERSRKAIEEADLTLILKSLDPETKNIQTNNKTISSEIENTIPESKILQIGTKLDLANSANINGNLDLCISSLENTNIAELKELIYSKITKTSSQIKINKRQADLLRKALSSLEKALKASEDKLPQDFWTIDLKASIQSLGEITGDVVTEELLDEIFSSFCIGK